MTSSNVFRISSVILLTLLGAYILISSFNILIVLMSAFIIASAVRPIVQTLIKWRFPAGLAIGLTYLALISIAILVSIVVLPPIFRQLIGYLENDDRLASRIIVAQTFFQDLIQDVTHNEIATISAADIRANVALVVQQIRDATPIVVNNIGELVSNIILILVIGVYWLTSRDKSIAFFTSLSPTTSKGKVAEIIHEIEDKMGHYLRGVIVIGSAVSLLNFIPLLVLRVPNALLLAAIVGITTVIPMIGGLIGGFIILTLTLLVAHEYALTVLVIFMIVQQIENTVLAPRIMSSSVGFDPVLVIVYTSVGLVLGGILGALLAVPVMATVHVLLKHFVISPHMESISEFATENGIALMKDRNKDEHIGGNEGNKILIADGYSNK